MSTPPKARADGGDHGPHRRVVTGVGDERGADPVGRGAQRVLAAGDQRHLRALGGERPRDRQADAAARAGDDRATPVQVQIHSDDCGTAAVVSPGCSARQPAPRWGCRRAGSGPSGSCGSRWSPRLSPLPSTASSTPVRQVADQLAGRGHQPVVVAPERRGLPQRPRPRHRGRDGAVDGRCPATATCDVARPGRRPAPLLADLDAGRRPPRVARGAGVVGGAGGAARSTCRRSRCSRPTCRPSPGATTSARSTRLVWSQLRRAAQRRRPHPGAVQRVGLPAARPGDRPARAVAARRRHRAVRPRPPGRVVARRDRPAAGSSSASSAGSRRRSGSTCSSRSPRCRACSSWSSATARSDARSSGSCPSAIFTGQLVGPELGRRMASLRPARAPGRGRDVLPGRAGGAVRRRAGHRHRVRWPARPGPARRERPALGRRRPRPARRAGRRASRRPAAARGARRARPPVGRAPDVVAGHRRAARALRGR